MDDKEEYIAAAKFMNQALRHIDKATEKQKMALLKLLLERPPEGNVVKIAEYIWAGLNEKELMSLMAKIQKKHDKEFWTFCVRWR